MSKRKKFIVILNLLLVATMIVTLCACDKNKDKNPEVKTLSAPTNLADSDDGTIMWDAVPNATQYTIYIGGQSFDVTTNSYKVNVTTETFTYFVIAKAQGYKNSPASETKTFIARDPVVPPRPAGKVSVAISGGSEIKSGQTLLLKSVVENLGTDDVDETVTWTVVEGGDFIRISGTGLVTAKEVDGDKIVKVRATSNENSKYYAEKVLTVVTRPVLTQEMLNALNGTKIGFAGFLNISLYTPGEWTKQLKGTYATNVNTAMDGEHWYAEYDNANTGLVQGMYYSKHENKACAVGLSFMNEEQYVPMRDENDNEISWENAGLYNSLNNLSLSDFTFDAKKWRWMYTGSDNTLMKKVVASANPYNFEPKALGLLIDEGQVMGIYAESNDDYSISEGYLAVQELFVAINKGETVVVPQIKKLTHDSAYDAEYSAFATAINNTRALDSYKLTYRSITGSFLTSGYTEEGFTEYVTKDECYFAPYSVSYDDNKQEVKKYAENSGYGFKKITDTLYNSYVQESDGTYRATRAYAASVDAAKPSFAFSAEIFNAFFKDEEAGTITFYANETVYPVASTFYFGLGNDINLYGIFATKAYLDGGKTLTPYVTIKDGYIVETGFYFFLGSVYGYVFINYDGFNATSLPKDVTTTFETRQVPTSWDQLTINVSKGSATSENEERNAAEFLKEFFGDENAATDVPFFGNALGDTFGFGLTTIHTPGGKTIAYNSIVFYYDVPLDVDYTINEPLRKVEAYLTELGFVKNKYGEFNKGNIWVAPTDSSLDLVIYIWKTREA